MSAPPPQKPEPPAKPEPPSREARLAAALRANLRRRKPAPPAGEDPDA